MSDRPVVSAVTASEQPRHLRPVEQERRGAKFAAVDHDVSRVLGPHRGAAIIYGILASAWFEFAPSERIEGKKRPAPGDWVEVSYDQFMAVTGTRAKASIIRWLRTLAEDLHACPWGRCGDEHPLVVVKRQGRTRSNRYRKWRCNEDELVLRPRVRSAALSAAAKHRVASGQQLNGIVQEWSLASDEPAKPDAQLDLKLSAPESLKSRSETSTPAPLKSYSETSRSLASELHEVSPRDFQKSRGETSYLEKDIKLEKPAAKGDAAAIEQADEVDAVACEVVDAILELAHRVEPEYPDNRAWEVARSLARSTLELCAGQAASARVFLLHAIGDHRLSRARNPIGLLIRGVVGDNAGKDRFLLAQQKPSDEEGVTSSLPTTNAFEALAPGLRETLIDAVQRGTVIDDRWLRGRDISLAALEIARKHAAEEAARKSATPLCDELAARDPTEYRRRLEEALACVEIPSNLGLRRSLDHPMLLGMCRARLERELGGDR